MPPELARSALDAAPDAILIIDPSGVIRYANRQVTTLFGYAQAELVGQAIEALMPERFRQRHIGHRSHYAASMRLRPMGSGLELFARRRDGSEFPVEISLSPMQEGAQTLAAAAIRDVTERKGVEAELIHARQAAERARQSADQARELADRANLGKSRFLATASHDLRQPLQTLSLLNGALRRTVTEPAAAEALAHQEQAIGAMSRLLNALLDISKLESGAIRPEPSDFTVAELFEELRIEFESLASSKGLGLRIESCSDCAHSDPSLVEQVLRNLVANAIKYTRAGWVQLRCLREASAIRLEVLDTGIGIPADQIGFIYDEFYQVDVPRNASREGYGLGLSIVQRIVQLLDLRLEVRSELGKGSVFSLLLPAAKARAARSSPDAQLPLAAPPLAAGAPRLLLVEDDPGVREATRLLLKVEGYQVVAVATQAEALAQAGQGVDVLVTDYHLAMGERGTQVIAALRAMLGPSLKAVLMTGDTSSAIRDLPTDPYLRVASKPIRAEELTALIRALIGR